MSGGVVALTGALDPRRYGGKAANLARARAAGLPVPAGLAVPVDVLDAVAAGDQDARAELVATLPALRPPLAVRSSAPDEDGAAASFAGQYASVLGVGEPAEVLAALGRVHASSGHAEAYRRRLGLAAGGSAGGVAAGGMAAVVQEAVAADAAGVLFTRDPLGGAGTRVEGAWGLGEAVVAGLVTPDRWLLDDGGRAIEAEMGDKDVASRLDPGRGGCRQEPVPASLRRVPCLEPATLRRLRALARRCEDVFGRAQDLEWAATGPSVHLLQARPQTCARRSR